MFECCQRLLVVHVFDLYLCTPAAHLREASFGSQMVWTKLREAASPEPSDEAPENRLACLRALNSEASGWVQFPATSSECFLFGLAVKVARFGCNGGGAVRERDMWLRQVDRSAVVHERRHGRQQTGSCTVSSSGRGSRSLKEDDGRVLFRCSKCYLCGAARCCIDVRRRASCWQSLRT